MAQVIYSARTLDELERLTDFLLQEDPLAAWETVDLMIEAIKILENHPLIGRSVEHDFHELVISRGISGYLALYSFDAQRDVVLILSIKHQREAGYVSG